MEPYTHARLGENEVCVYTRMLNLRLYDDVDGIVANFAGASGHSVNLSDPQLRLKLFGGKGLTT